MTSPAIIFRKSDTWLDQRQPWVQLASFVVTVLLATRQHWSAREMAWSFWLAGLLLGLIYIPINQIATSLRTPESTHPSRASRAMHALRAMAGTYFVLFFAYLIFAGFLDTIFNMIAFEAGREELTWVFASLPAMLNHILTQRWPFLVASGIAHLPAYVHDAVTVEFTDFSKPIFARDLLRMVILIFILVPLTMVGLGILALYAILFVYFLPWSSIRQITRQVRGLSQGTRP